MNRINRKAPLPNEMQGEWFEAGDLRSRLIVEQGEVFCNGTVVDYDFKLVDCKDGVVMVSLKIEDEQQVPEFQRTYITELVFTPNGELHAYNVKFAAVFVRPNDN